MADEQTVTEEVRPSDEAATAFLMNGDRTAVEPQESKPVAQQEAPAPAAQVAPPVQERSETEMLKQELNRLKSQMGQLNKLRSEFSKPQETKQTPQSWAQMTPEQQAAMLELVDHAWSQKYGADWKEIQEAKEERRITAQIQSVENFSRQFAGDLHKELDPIMGRIYVELRDKANSGDDDAAQIVHEIQTTRFGVKYLVDLAKQEYSQSIEAKGQQAQAAQAASAKRAGVTLGQTPQTPPKGDILKNLPSDPAKAAEMLRAELVKQGAL